MREAGKEGGRDGGDRPESQGTEAEVRQRNLWFLGMSFIENLYRTNIAKLLLMDYLSESKFNITKFQ